MPQFPFFLNGQVSDWTDSGRGLGTGSFKCSQGVPAGSKVGDHRNRVSEVMMQDNMCLYAPGGTGSPGLGHPADDCSQAG